MIIAVDFDGTLRFDDGSPNMPLIKRLKANQRNGDTVILWTSRRNVQEAVMFLKRCGFIPNLVNANAPQAIKMLGHDPRKIYADLYIDDKAVKF